MGGEIKHGEVPPDSFLWRWTKFLSIIFVPAIILGIGLVFHEYFMATQGKTWAQRDEAREFVQQDTWESFRGRFIIGVCIGGSLGATYVVRCLIRRVDP